MAVDKFQVAGAVLELFLELFLIAKALLDSHEELLPHFFYDTPHFFYDIAKVEIASIFNITGQSSYLIIIILFTTFQINGQPYTDQRISK